MAKSLFTLALGAGTMLLLCQPARLCAGISGAQMPELSLLSSSTFGFRAGLLQAETPGQKEVETSGTAQSAIKAVLERATTPNLQALADALGITSPEIGSKAFGSSMVGMEVVGDLDGDGVPEVAANWRLPEHGGNGTSASVPNLYLLSWNGKAWQASHLIKAASAFDLKVLAGNKGPARLLAVVTFQGVTAIPYPIIFQYRDHAASMLWDGRRDSSRYTGYDFGAVEFSKAVSGGVPAMIVSGQADPGLLVFPKQPEGSRRGFQETTLYHWQNNAYVPVKTEYTPDQDYTLYRFIADLHLHDFRGAYSLIDPQQFLKTHKPNLKLFRERIEKDWPEFLDDKIFRVPTNAQDQGDHVFTLPLNNGNTYVYQPSFTAGPKFLLNALARKEASE